MKGEPFPIKITFYIEPDGKVTISSLFTPVLPIAFSLAPDDERLCKILKDTSPDIVDRKQITGGK